MVTFILVLIGPPIYTLPKMLSCSFGPSMCSLSCSVNIFSCLSPSRGSIEISNRRGARRHHHSMLQVVFRTSILPHQRVLRLPARLYTLLDRRRMRSMRLMRCMHITAIPITLPRSPILYRLQLLPRSHPPLCVLRPFFVLLFPLLVPSCLLLPSSFGVLLDQCIVWPKFRILLPDAASFEVVE
jgi:hypothetical protein